MPLEEGRGGIREKSFSKSVLIGTLLRDMHPATRAAFTVEPRHEMFFFLKVSLLYNFSVTEAASSISFHNLESSPELTYRAVVEHHFRQEEWMILVNCSLVDPCSRL